MGIYRYKKKYKYRRILLAGIFILLTFLLVLNSEQNYKINFQSEFKSNLFQIQTKYLINTTNCKIADIDPFNDEVLEFIKNEKYKNCSNKPLLTYIEKSSNGVKLKINKSVIYLYSGFRINCCYSNITRKDVDKKIMYSKCLSFHDEIEIFYPFIRVICKNLFYSFYKNVHATFIPPINKTLTSTHSDIKENKNIYKIFIVGIDSLSRINLQRSMKKTWNYLEKNYISFRGYNKIEENTFPNLIAILTGRKYKDLIGSPCSTNSTFDKCDFIWKTYHNRLGYITALGEDEPEINTFNYLKQGFIKPPTDYYMRPYMIAAYKLRTNIYDYMNFCTGPENPAERILNSAKDFEITMKNYRTFSFFWMNSFSHDNFNLPSAMDGKFYDFLTDTEILNATENSIVIVLSDHGFRFGNIRYTYTGRMEDRLPFLYVKFPKRFIDNNPIFYRNFQHNAQSRLVTPFDLHMTLQHLLNLAEYDNNNKKITMKRKTCIGCTKCLTLFEKLPENRSCSSSCIDELWCTCSGYYFIDNKGNEAVNIAKFVISNINSIITNYPNGKRLCSSYELEKIWSIGRVKHNNSFTYIIMLETVPKAMFEANLRINMTTNKIELLNDIKRINRYQFDSSCVKDIAILQQYCYCDNITSRIVSNFLRLFHFNIV